MNAVLPPFEDELGDVLDKGIMHAGLTVVRLAEKTGVAAGRIQDALDYRYGFEAGELEKIGSALDLNGEGLAALAGGRYPRPEMPSLPFCLRPLHIPYGVGVVNAHLVRSTPDAPPVLFDTGCSGETLMQALGEDAARPAAVVLTHPDRDHVGGLGALADRFPGLSVHGPRGAAFHWRELGEGEVLEAGGLRITAFATPGHAASHNCYRVEAPGAAQGRMLLVSGDLIFAGSMGRAFYSVEGLLCSARRMLEMHPDDTVIAPGHGPLTTAGNERRFNPFFGPSKKDS